MLQETLKDRFPFKYESEPDCGVIACCNDDYFPALVVLWSSLQNQIPFTLFDNGLTGERLEWCQEKMNVLRIPNVMPKEVVGWQAYDKPFYIDASPYRYTLWADTDCIFVKSPKVIFDYIKQQLLLIEHRDVQIGQPYPGHNDSKLYDVFKVKEIYGGDKGINSGVVGLDLKRDSEFLEGWKRNTRIAANDGEIQKLLSWWDEGVCHWTMAELGLYSLVKRDNYWNRFFYCHKANAIDHVLALQPEENDVIIHCTGQPKYWRGW